MTTRTPPAILHIDHDLVVVDKPAGVLVHRSRIDARAERVLLQDVRDALGRHVWPVHRLDKGTSGALLLALHRDAAAVLSGAFAAGVVEKRYLALVRGWPPCAGTIDHALAPRDDDAERMSAEERAAAAQSAVTAYRRLARIELPVAVDRHPTTRYAFLEVLPLTGRRHQIRRHLKHIAHPLVGDATFGKGRHNRFVAALTGVTRLWLHAWMLAFPHPRADAFLRVEAPPGGEWARLLDRPGWQYDATRDGEDADLLARLSARPSLVAGAAGSPSAASDRVA